MNFIALIFVNKTLVRRWKCPLPTLSFPSKLSNVASTCSTKHNVPINKRESCCFHKANKTLFMPTSVTSCIRSGHRIIIIIIISSLKRVFSYGKACIDCSLHFFFCVTVQHCSSPAWLAGAVRAVRAVRKCMRVTNSLNKICKSVF
jgi:hypothetical protein